jgi:hypothetical protein
MTEIQHLAAETLAIQTIIAHVFDELIRDNPALRKSVRKGFDHAAGDLEQMGVQRSKGPMPPHIVKALSIIEDLRTATLGNPSKPKHAV